MIFLRSLGLFLIFFLTLGKGHDSLSASCSQTLIAQNNFNLISLLKKDSIENQEVSQFYKRLFAEESFQEIIDNVDDISTETSHSPFFWRTSFDQIRVKSDGTIVIPKDLPKNTNELNAFRLKFMEQMTKHFLSSYSIIGFKKRSFSNDRNKRNWNNISYAEEKIKYLKRGQQALYKLANQLKGRWPRHYFKEKSSLKHGLLKDLVRFWFPFYSPMEKFKFNYQDWRESNKGKDIQRARQHRVRLHAEWLKTQVLLASVIMSIPAAINGAYQAQPYLHNDSPLMIVAESLKEAESSNTIEITDEHRQFARELLAEIENSTDLE